MFHSSPLLPKKQLKPNPEPDWLRLHAHIDLWSYVYMGCDFNTVLCYHAVNSRTLLYCAMHLSSLTVILSLWHVLDQLNKDGYLSSVLLNLLLLLNF